MAKLMQEAVGEKKREALWAKPGGTRLEETDIARQRKLAGLKKAQGKLEEAQGAQRVVIEQARLVLAAAEIEVQACKDGGPASPS